LAKVTLIVKRREYGSGSSHVVVSCHLSFTLSHRWINPHWMRN